MTVEMLSYYVIRISRLWVPTNRKEVGWEASEACHGRLQAKGTQGGPAKNPSSVEKGGRATG